MTVIPDLPRMGATPRLSTYEVARTLAAVEEAGESVIGQPYATYEQIGGSVIKVSLWRWDGDLEHAEELLDSALFRITQLKELDR